MANDDFCEFEEQLQKQSREKPPGTLARLAPDAGAYWTGRVLKGIFIGCDGDGSDNLDEEFDLQLAWRNWRTDLEEWLAAPRFENRPIISDWIEQGIA